MKREMKIGTKETGENVKKQGLNEVIHDREP
jgi:hypothetical protein